MAFDATVYRVLVASPSDVGEERNIVPEVINEWNAMHSNASLVVLLPVKWETNTSPMLGGRPQEIINSQIVRDADLLIGLFWTRIGTPTGAAPSGTAEEIEEFVAQKKPVMLYFSQSPIDPERIDVDQFKELRDFKEKMRLQGLTESYTGMPDFRQKFSRQLTLAVSNILPKQLADSKTNQRSTRKTTAGSDSRSVSLDTAAKGAAAPVITIEQERQYLTAAMNATKRDDGWASLPAFAKYLSTYTPIDYRNFGFEKLKPYIESRGMFEFQSITPTNVLIRRKISS